MRDARQRRTTAATLRSERAAPDWRRTVATGTLEITVAARLWDQVPGGVFIGAAGGLSLVLGIAILLWPTTGAAALGALVGAYGIAFGGAMVGQAVWSGSARRSI